MKPFEERIAKIKEELTGKETTPYSEIAHLEEKYGLVEKHQKLIRLLNEIDRICRTNDIKYSISYGTLMGAMRHGRFIPWDDDADIMMTREEFDKFKAALKNESSAFIFKVVFVDRFTTKELFEEGVFIDIFIFDHEPERKWKRKWAVLFSKFLRLSFFSKEAYAQKAKGMGGIKKAIFACVYFICMLIGTVTRLILGNNIIRINEKMVYSLKGKPGKYLISLNSTWVDLGRFFLTSWFDNYTEIELCGNKYMVIEKAEDFLIHEYGDWLTLPSEEKRVPEHEEMLNKDKKWTVLFWDESNKKGAS